MGAEDQEQAAVMLWARSNADIYPELDFLFAVPNGGLRNKATAARLKATGTLAGVSDLILLVPRGGYHGICLEMKAPGGRVSPAQKAFLAFEQRQGYCAVVCYDRFEAIKTIIAYLTYQLHWPQATKLPQQA